MNIISEREVIDYILRGNSGNNPRFACYFGAGVSAEAGVKTAWQICDEIRKEKARMYGYDLRRTQTEPKQPALNFPEIDAELHWNDPSRRYSESIRAYAPSIADRVSYFRDMLQGVKPAFFHHALALISAEGYFKRTSFTTNFDKLLENAFVQQNMVECQPIRTEEEANLFWDDSRHHVIKLHGDYDTQNILNIDQETTRLNDVIENRVERILENAGLIVIGAAGFERSVQYLFDNLSDKCFREGLVLRYGLFWGVYMGEARPEGLTHEKLHTMVERRLRDDQVIAPQIQDMMRIRSDLNRAKFCFFPVWGSGDFLFELIREAARRHQHALLLKTAEQYLDREMRVRYTLKQRGNLTPSGIEAYTSKLDNRRKTTENLIKTDGAMPEAVYEVQSTTSSLRIRILYGDMSNREFMMRPEFQRDTRGRLAVVSPEDTLITAGGGLAEILLDKAGSQRMLYEIAKFSPIQHGAVAVTSAGNLPVHYIFHAAAVKINPDGTPSFQSNDTTNHPILNGIPEKNGVLQATMTVLVKAYYLNVSAIWLPLMGTGTGGLDYKQSLASSLKAIKYWEADIKTDLLVQIFIFKERSLPRHEVHDQLEEVLGSSFQFLPIQER